MLCVLYTRLGLYASSILEKKKCLESRKIHAKFSQISSSPAALSRAFLVLFLSFISCLGPPEHKYML